MCAKDIDVRTLLFKNGDGGVSVENEGLRTS